MGCSGEVCWAIMVTWLSVSEKCRTQGEPYPPRRDVAQRRLFSGLPNETYTGPALEFKASNHRRVILPSASTYREFHPNWAPRSVFSWGLNPGSSALSHRNPPTPPPKKKERALRGLGLAKFGPACLLFSFSAYFRSSPAAPEGLRSPSSWRPVDPPKEKKRGWGGGARSALLAWGGFEGNIPASFFWDWGGDV